jgi:hypothetical protein
MATLYTRLSDEMLAQVREAAESQHLSLNQYVILALEQQLDGVPTAKPQVGEPSSRSRGGYKRWGKKEREAPAPIVQPKRIERLSKDKQPEYDLGDDGIPRPSRGEDWYTYKDRIGRWWGSHPPKPMDRNAIFRRAQQYRDDLEAGRPIHYAGEPAPAVAEPAPKG